MDIYGDDIDTLLQNDDDLNENIREDDIAEDDDGEKAAEGNAETDENGEPKIVEPKKRAVRNPQVRLNVERLKSDRGIHTLEKYCTDLKFRGKGYEKEDLNALMKRLEHWAHRLYPNYKFDDFVACVEKLGKKKQMQTHMYRYRHGLLEDVANKNTDTNAENAEDNGSQFGDGAEEPMDEMDEIIEQQIQNYTIAAPKTPAHDRTFDSIRSSIVASPRFHDQNPVASTPIVKATNVERNDASTAVQPTTATLTAEQMAKIAENRRLAQERLRKKQMEMAAAKAATALNENENSSLVVDNDDII